MFMRFEDSIDCSIEFEANTATEKKILRDIYMKLIGMTGTERTECLMKVLEDSE